jgi:hypothetical protein
MDSGRSLGLVSYSLHGRLQSEWVSGLCQSAGRYPPPHGILRHTRLTVSFPTAPPNKVASARLTWLAPLEPPAQTPSPTPEAAVATEVDMERAKVQKSYWYRRRYWRRRW